MRTSTCKGMTLIEVIIASGILSVMMFTMMTFAASLSTGVSIEQQKLLITQSANTTIDGMVEMMEAAFIPDAWALPDDGDDSIRFLVPVDHDQDGDILAFEWDATGGEWMPTVEWGAIRDDHTPGHFLDGSHDGSDAAQSFFTTYSYVKTGEFDESVRGFDLNLNGSRTDVFDVGHIEKTYSAGYSPTYGIDMPERTAVLTPDIVLRLPQTSGGIWPDIDNDGDTDPLFQLTGSQLIITMFVSRTDEATPLFEKIQTTAELRNMNLGLE